MTGVGETKKLPAWGKVRGERYTYSHTKLPSETPLFRLSRIGDSFATKIIRNLQREAQAVLSQWFSSRAFWCTRSTVVTRHTANAKFPTDERKNGTLPRRCYEPATSPSRRGCLH